MRALTGNRPKALVPVLGRPFADWQLSLLAQQGIERVTYCIGFGGEALRRHVGDGRRFGLDVTWVSEGDELRGTAGALRLALDQSALEEAFFVLYGDSYLLIEMKAVAEHWAEQGMPAQMTVLRNEGRWDRSNAVYARGRVLLFDKNRLGPPPTGMDWIDYGLSIMSRDLIRDRVPRGSVADLADLMKVLSVEGILGAYEVNQRFYEVGSPQGLADLEAYLAGTGGDQSTPRNH